MKYQPLDGHHKRRWRTRCPDEEAAPLLPSSPRITAHGTSDLAIDSSDGSKLLSCESEGWDEHLRVKGT